MRSLIYPLARKTKTNLNILNLLTYMIINLILPPYKYSVCCSSVMVGNIKSTFHPLLQKIPYIGKIAVDQYFYFCDNSPFRLNKKTYKNKGLLN